MCNIKVLKLNPTIFQNGIWLFRIIANGKEIVSDFPLALSVETDIKKEFLVGVEAAEMLLRLYNFLSFPLCREEIENYLKYRFKEEKREMDEVSSLSI